MHVAGRTALPRCAKRTSEAYRFDLCLLRFDGTPSTLQSLQPTFSLPFNDIQRSCSGCYEANEKSLRIGLIRQGPMLTMNSRRRTLRRYFAGLRCLRFSSIENIMMCVTSSAGTAYVGMYQAAPKGALATL